MHVGDQPVLTGCKECLQENRGTLRSRDRQRAVMASETGSGSVGYSEGTLERMLEEVSCRGGALEDGLEGLNSFWWAIGGPGSRDSLFLVKTFGPVASASK